MIALSGVLGSFTSHLQAWNEFVKISFPDEQFNARWKSTLLADLERRIQEVPGAVGGCCLRAELRRMGGFPLCL